MAVAQRCTCLLSKSLIHFGDTSSEVRCGCTSDCHGPQLQLVSGLQTLVVALRNVFQLVHVLVMVQGDDLHSRTGCCFCKWRPMKSTPLSCRCKAHASKCFACLMFMVQNLVYTQHIKCPLQSSWLKVGPVCGARCLPRVSASLCKHALYGCTRLQPQRQCVHLWSV